VIVINNRMAEKRASTHTAYTLKREGRTTGRWLEIGVASLHEDGKGFHVQLDRLPIGGFTGHVLVRANDARPEQPGMHPALSDDDDQL